MATVKGPSSDMLTRLDATASAFGGTPKSMMDKAQKLYKLYTVIERTYDTVSDTLSSRPVQVLLSVMFTLMGYSHLRRGQRMLGCAFLVNAQVFYMFRNMRSMTQIISDLKEQNGQYATQIDSHKKANTALKKEVAGLAKQRLMLQATIDIQSSKFNTQIKELSSQIEALTDERTKLSAEVERVKAINTALAGVTGSVESEVARLEEAAGQSAEAAAASKEAAEVATATIKRQAAEYEAQMARLEARQSEIDEEAAHLKAAKTQSTAAHDKLMGLIQMASMAMAMQQNKSCASVTASPMGVAY